MPVSSSNVMCNISSPHAESVITDTIIIFQQSVIRNESNERPPKFHQSRDTIAIDDITHKTSKPS